MHLKRIFFIFFIVTVCFLATGCADNETLTDCARGHTYGFWGGLWHGFIAPFGVIGMILFDDVAMYAPNNNGIWYSIGFLLGCGHWFFVSRKE